MDKRPPKTESPRPASPRPKVTVAPELFVEEAPEELEDPVDDPRVVASAVVLQMNVPWMTFPLPASASKPLQSMEAVD